MCLIARMMTRCFVTSTLVHLSPYCLVSVSSFSTPNADFKPQICKNLDPILTPFLRSFFSHKGVGLNVKNTEFNVYLISRATVTTLWCYAYWNQYRSYLA